MNKKLLLAALLCFDIGLMLTFANATMTDGNYVMIAYDTIGSGETTTTDTNYVMFANTGETATAQTIADNNYNAGIGFYGNPFGIFVEIITTIFPEVSLIFLQPENGAWLGVIIFIMLAGFVLIYFYVKKEKENNYDSYYRK